MVPKEQAVRLKVIVRGAVQGVGFRPFVYRLATALGLRGTVSNSTDGVRIEAEGPQPVLEDFLLRLRSEPPPRSRITSLESAWLDGAGLGPFQILQSTNEGPKRTLLLPDIATCPECLAEIFDPANRRYSYPFTNCVNCGPRFTIIEALPYDRANTSMRSFRMCPACQAEYDNPGDRRFHAQPNACPVCGPHLELWDASGSKLSGEPGADAAAVRGTLQRAAEVVLKGGILAVKGLGGFHLLADAQNERAVRELRARKRREEKPFAVMFATMEELLRYCEANDTEQSLLNTPESPIVLLRKNKSHRLAESTAPGNPTLGAMLPYTPLHHLLMHIVGRAVIATSGNLSDEPICTDEHEAVTRLTGIADSFLAHNRPIVRHVDDSIVRIFRRREMVLRRARGYAPLPVTLKSFEADQPVLAVGAHLKNTIALGTGNSVFLSQHIGDLETEAAYAAFVSAVSDLPRIYEIEPQVIAADAHPEYISTRYATEQSQSRGLRLVTVQHHVAHALGCMAENELEPPLTGVAWDGTGFGTDGSVWGGEFFEVTTEQCKRIAHLRQFPLPGGEAAVKEPRRCAAGVLFEILGERAFESQAAAWVSAFETGELNVLRQMLVRGVNAPRTSSVGRLFDAVSSIAGLRQITRHEGQAAMELEFAAEGASADPYAVNVVFDDRMGVADWEPMIRTILSDVQAGRPPGEISAAFHNALAEVIVQIATRVGHENVVLSGGCFQNVRLLEAAVGRLVAAGFKPAWHQRVPPNDGGIALGQVVAALRYPHNALGVT